MEMAIQKTMTIKMKTARYQTNETISGQAKKRTYTLHTAHNMFFIHQIKREQLQSFRWLILIGELKMYLKSERNEKQNHTHSFEMP